MKFTANDFITELPDQWEDRTMVTLLAPFAAGEFASNIVITRHFLESGSTLEDFVNAQLQMMRESLPAFELLDRRFTETNNFASYQQLHRFQSEDGVLQQVQTFLLAEKTVFVITGTAQVEKFDVHIAAFRRVVENFQVK